MFFPSNFVMCLVNIHDCLLLFVSTSLVFNFQSALQEWCTDIKIFESIQIFTMLHLLGDLLPLHLKRFKGYWNIVNKIYSCIAFSLSLHKFSLFLLNF